MATPAQKSSPQDNILNCPICMDIYKTPRMLPCQHTMCESCLHSYIVNKSRERVLVSDFPCPVCRTSTPAPKAFTRIDLWASLFPLNHLLVSLLDTNFLAERVIPADTAELARCTDHPMKPIEFFCVDHEAVICSKCFKNAHRHCNVNDIEEHLELTSRQVLIKLDIENLQKYLDEVICHLKSNIEQLGNERSNILQEVKEFRSKVDSFLLNLETDIKEQINMHHDKAIVVLKSHCEKYERIKAEVEISEKSLDDVSGLGDFGQAVASLTTLENDVKSHSTVLESCKSSVVVVKLKFTLTAQLTDFLNSLSQLGTVCVDEYEAQLPPLEDILSKQHGEQLVPSPRGVVVTPVQSTSPRTRPTGQAFSTQTEHDLSNQAAQQRRSFQGHENARQRKESKRHSTVSIGSAAVTPIVVRPLAGRPQALNLALESTATAVHSDASVSNAATSPLINTRSFRAINSPPSSEQLPNADDPLPEFLENLATLNHSTSSPLHNVETRDQNADCANGLSQPRGFVDPATTISASDLYENTIGVQYRIIRKIDSGTRPRRLDSSSDESENTNGIENKLRKPSRSLSDSENFPMIDEVGSVERKTERRKCSKTSSESDPFATVDGANALLPSSESDEDNKSIKAHKICSIPVKVSKDTHECTITGATLLPEGRIVLVDCNNSRVKLMSKDFTCQSYVDMSKEPWNVASTSPNEVAVTVPLEKSLHVIRVVEAKMTLLPRITTRFECWGICHVNGLLGVTTKDDGNAVVFMDKNGIEVQRISFDSRANANTGVYRPVSITYSPTNHLLFVCCEGHSGTKGSLVTLTLQGQIVNVYADKDMDRPYSSAVDSQNRIFVTGIRSSSVSLLSIEGEKLSTLLTRENGLSRPQHIQVLHDTDRCRVLLSERRSENVTLYEIK